MYQLTANGVLRQDDQAFIPNHPHNRDWIAYQQWLQAGHSPAANDQLDQSKAQASAQVMLLSKQKRIAIAGTNDEIEISAWNNKLRIAQAFAQGQASAADIAALEKEIALRKSDESVRDLCNKIVFKAAYFSQAIALIDGLKYQALKAIEAADQVAVIDQAISVFLQSLDAALQELEHSTQNEATRLGNPLKRFFNWFIA